jgi:hypothetical protein
MKQFKSFPCGVCTPSGAPMTAHHFRSWRAISTLIIIVLVFASYLSAAGTFWDDFDGSSLDLTKWGYQDRNWPIGQTWFMGVPTIFGGIATFEHHTYNQYDPGNSCLGQEIYTHTAFSPGPGFGIEVRVRLRPPISSGLVSSVFGYTDKTMPDGAPVWSDEIDFEFLSNQVNNPPESTGHRVFVASWNDFGAPGSGYYDSVHHWGENPVVPALDLTEFNTFKILWTTDSVQWYWDPDQIRGQDHFPDILISETSSAMPDEPLTLRMNFWASTLDWPLAWDSAMEPASNSADDIVSYYDVDYIRTMRIPAPDSLLLVAIGLLSLRFIRRLRY